MSFYVVTEDSELVYRTDLNAANVRIKQLEAALYEITVECNVIKEIVRTTLDQSSPPKVLLPCPVCGGKAIHAIDVLRRTIIQPARQENDDVFKGFRGNNDHS